MARESRDGVGGGEWTTVPAPISIKDETRERFKALAQELVSTDEKQFLPVLDFTSAITNRDYRDLDRLARLLNNKTSVCAAVAIDPGASVADATLVIAFNNDELIDRARQIMAALTALSNGPTLTLEQQRDILSVLDIGKPALTRITGAEGAEALPDGLAQHGQTLAQVVRQVPDLAKVQRLLRKIKGERASIQMRFLRATAVGGTADQTMHAEAKVAAWFLLNRAEHLPAYIGISMHCCLSCSLWMRALYDSAPRYRGESPYGFGGVVVPRAIADALRTLDLTMPDMRSTGTSGSQQHCVSDSECSDTSTGRVMGTTVLHVAGAALDRHLASIAPTAAGGDGGGSAPPAPTHSVAGRDAMRRFVPRGDGARAVNNVRTIVDRLNRTIASRTRQSFVVLKAVAEQIQTEKAVGGHYWHTNPSVADRAIAVLVAPQAFSTHALSRSPEAVIPTDTWNALINSATTRMKDRKAIDGINDAEKASLATHLERFICSAHAGDKRSKPDTPGGPPAGTRCARRNSSSDALTAGK